MSHMYSSLGTARWQTYCILGMSSWANVRHLKHLVAYWSPTSSQKPENLSHWRIHHDISPVISKFAQNHLLVFPMQLVALTVEITTMHPVRWLCSTPVPEWAQWYSTSVGSQGLLHLAQLLCVWRVGGGVRTHPRWCAELWQQQYQQVERRLQCIGLFTGSYSAST